MIALHLYYSCLYHRQRAISQAAAIPATNSITRNQESCSHTDLDDVIFLDKVSKDAKIRNRYNQVPHLTQDNNGKVTNSQLDTTNESQGVSPFPAGDHKAHLNRRPQNTANTRQNKNIKDPQKKYRLGTVSKIFYWMA